VAIMVFIAHLCLLLSAPKFGYDFKIFWEVGRDVWDGIDPYQPQAFERHPFLNPPSALPLFALFASLPQTTSNLISTGVNLLSAISLAPLSIWLLRSDPMEHKSPSLKESLIWNSRFPLLICITAASLFTEASRGSFYTGQLSMLVAFSLLAAAICQFKGRPIASAALLCLGTAKIATMAPFLLLFFRKRDWMTWIGLCVMVLAACLVATPMTELKLRVTELWQYVAVMSSEGATNDYSFSGP